MITRAKHPVSVPFHFDANLSISDPSVLDLKRGDHRELRGRSGAAEAYLFGHTTVIITF